ncbi:unnamed protein product [Linum trigynum]|uniref:Uncharacterized protein n=1 Tax=Linum trigynum TaxID=586398 RepID=A0AAV2CJS1_9ROSI
MGSRRMNWKGSWWKTAGRPVELASQTAKRWVLGSSPPLSDLEAWLTANLSRLTFHMGADPAVRIRERTKVVTFLVAD